MKMTFLNIEDLMLRKDVVRAIEQKKFHIYAIKTIDEGVEVLTGVKAGKMMKGGSYERGSVNYLANQKLADLAVKMKEFGTKKKPKRAAKKKTVKR